MTNSLDITLLLVRLYLLVTVDQKKKVKNLFGAFFNFPTLVGLNFWFTGEIDNMDNNVAELIEWIKYS